MVKNKQRQTGRATLTICTIELTAQAPPKKGYPLVPQSYGDYIKQFRLDYGYTQFEMAMEFEVYKSTIDKWERGTCNPNEENQQKIIEFLGYDPIQKTLTQSADRQAF